MHKSTLLALVLAGHCLICAAISELSDPCLNKQLCYWSCKVVHTVCSQAKHCDTSGVARLEKRVERLSEALRKVKTERKDCSGVETNGRCFFLMDDEGRRDMLPYHEAMVACARRKAHLAHLDSASVYNRVYKYIERNANDFLHSEKQYVITWTGASYENSTVFMGKRASSFVHWAKHHPFNIPQRNKIALAVSLKGGQKHMLDVMPNSSFYPLCEQQLRVCEGVLYLSRCFFLLDSRGLPDMKTFSNAQQACRAKQGKLALMDSAVVYDTVYEFVLNNSHDFLHTQQEFVVAWTGALYTNSTLYLGERVSPFVRWAKYLPVQSPSNTRVAMAVALEPDRRDMINARPTSKFYPLCEKTVGVR